MISFIIFIGAIISIVALFVFKHIELKKGHKLFAGELRGRCDSCIVDIEAHCGQKCTRANILHTVKHGYNSLAHVFAKVTANIAKRVEWRARSVAHKSAKAKQDGVEVRENGYLKDVQSHKDSLDTQRVADEAKL